MPAEELFWTPEQVDARRTAITDALRDDPFIRIWAAHTEPGWIARTAADVLGEQRAYAFLLASRPDNFLGIADRKLSDGRVVTRNAIALAIAVNILESPAYLWRDQIRHAALSAPLPEHWVDRSVLPVPSMWWSFESGVRFEDGTGVIDSCLVTDGGNGLTAVFMGSMNPNRSGEMSGPLFTLGVDIEYGHVMPDPEHPDHNAEGVLSMLSFLNSPYSEEERLGLSHSQRRTWRNNHPDAPSPGVGLVKLRERRVRNISSGEDTREVEWQHRWWIRGHHRNQWYPSTGTHKVIYIPPYIKGPSDKPFIYKVYDVSR